MDTQVLEPTPAQLRMAKAREARKAKTDAVAEDMAQSLDPDLIAQATEQRDAKIAAAQAAAQREARDQAESRGIVPGPTRGEVAGMKAEQERLERERAARRAVSGVGEEVVTVRVTKAGNNRISKGVHAPGIGDAHYEWKDEFTIPLSIAKVHEDNGLVEIQE